MTELAALGAQADAIVRNVEQLSRQIYAHVPRDQQRDLLHAFRRALNHATRFHHTSARPLADHFPMTTTTREDD